MAMASATKGSPRPLDGCYLKLARARTHLDTLTEAINQAIGSEPEQIQGEFDVDQNRYVFRAQRDVDAPLEWSGLVGDVVHNLSAGLDYLAWELVAANHQDGTTRTAFPI